MPMDELSRLTELFGDKMSVGELAIILARHDNHVQDAAWGILNGEKVDLEQDSFGSLGYDDGKDDRQGGGGGDDQQKRRSSADDGDLLEGFPALSPASSEHQPSPSFQKQRRRASFCAGSTGSRAAASAAEEEEGVEVDAHGRTDGVIRGSRSADDSALCSSSSSAASTQKYTEQYAQQQAAHPRNDSRNRKKATTTTSSRLRSLGSKLQKLNVARLIDQMEQDQEVADHLDFINRENAEEEERKAMVREAEQRSLELMHDHLEEFLRRNPRSTYERWIEELHPDNVQDRGLSESQSLLGGDVDSSWMEVDHRFYVEDSDHRRLWNQSLSDRDDGDRRAYVPARTLRDVPGRKIVDLLGGDDGTAANDDGAAAKAEAGRGGEVAKNGGEDDDEDRGGGPAKEEGAATSAGTDHRAGRRSHPWEEKASTASTEATGTETTARPATDRIHLIENLYSSDEEERSEGHLPPPPSSSSALDDEEEEEIAFELPDSS